MQQSRASSSLTPDEFVLLTIENDTKEAPWIVMGDPQMRSVTSLYWALSEYMREHQPDWFVGSMLPIVFRRPGVSRRTGQLGPDLFVARTETRARQSYSLIAGEPVPAFVLEVLSPESVRRDVETKRAAYNALGVQEYALFAPTGTLGQPPLQGFRRDMRSGEFVLWELEGERLWSEVLALWLVPSGRELRAQHADDAMLPTYTEIREREKTLESEVERLRAELARRGRD